MVARGGGCWREDVGGVCGMDFSWRRSGEENGIFVEEVVC